MGGSPSIPQYNSPTFPGSAAGQGPSFIQTPSGGGLSSELSGINTTSTGALSGNLANMFGGSPAYQAAGSPTGILGSSVLGDISSAQASQALYNQMFPAMVQGQNASQYNMNQALSQVPWALGSQLTNAQNFAGMLPGLVGQGQNVAGLGNTLTGMGVGTAGVGAGLAAGNQPLNPLVQQSMQQAGYGSAASALGGAASLGGTAGQAAVARNLGANIQSYIQNQQALGGQLLTAGSGAAQAGAGVNATGVNTIGNAYGIGNTMNQNIISNANQLFGLNSSIMAPKQIGIGGQGVASLEAANYAGQNNMNAYLYGTQIQGAQFNEQISAANANAAAQSSGNLISGGASVIGTAAAAAAFSCWLAREVFGVDNPEWKRFRHWMMNYSPYILRSLYLRFGPGIAKFIGNSSLLKSSLRPIMQLLAHSKPYAFEAGI